MGEHLGTRSVPLATGITVACRVGGNPAGPSVVLLHPWLESQGSFDRLLGMLPGWMRLVALDLRGHGASDKPADGYDLPGVAEDVVALLDAVASVRAVLVGASSGGYVAQQVALTHPERVAGLVLVGSPRSLAGRPPFADDVAALTDPIDPAWAREFLTWFPLHQDVPPGYVEDRVADSLRVPAELWRATLTGLTSAVPPTDRGVIDVPTLILAGDRDDLITPADQPALAARIPGSALRILPEVGHLVLWEVPELVAAEVAAFVAGLAGAGPPTGWSQPSSRS